MSAIENPPFTFQKKELKNGLMFFYCQTPHTIVFDLSLYINAGSRDETKQKNGISHFLEHMMFRGSKDYPNSVLLARALESLGGEVNAMTGVEHTHYWVKGYYEKTLEGIDVFSKMMLTPIFADIEIERKVILQEMASDYNDHDELIDTESLSMWSLFGEHALGLSVIGDVAAVSKLTAEDLRQRYLETYVPGRCVLALASCLPFEEVLPQVEKCFVDAWPVHEAFPWSRGSKIFSERPHTMVKKPHTSLVLQNNADNQFSVKFLFPTMGGFQKEVALLAAFQRLLDDGMCTRLPGNIREKHGLVYDISCDTQFFQDGGVFSIEATISEDNDEKSVVKFLDKMFLEIQELLLNPPTQEEVEYVKYRYLFDLKQIAETPSRFLHRYAVGHFMNMSFSIKEEMDVISHLTSEDLFQEAKRVLGSHHRSLVFVGPKARKLRNDVERFLNNWDDLIRKQKL